MPGPRLDGAGLTELMNAEGVTICCGVPTVHLGLLAHWRASGESVPSLETVTTGGAAADVQLDLGVPVPGNRRRPRVGDDRDQPRGHRQQDHRRRGGAGRRGPGRLPHEAGTKALRCGAAGGRRPTARRSPGTERPSESSRSGAPGSASAYLGDEPGSALDADGWFSTGDVAVLHPDGTMQITDRKKDLIKSGGEWISSLDLENAAARHPEIAMAAVIGVPHEKWGERPLLIAQPAPGASPTKESVIDVPGRAGREVLPARGRDLRRRPPARGHRQGAEDPAPGALRQPRPTAPSRESQRAGSLAPWRGRGAGRGRDESASVSCQATQRIS